jgi:hypothetical protein
MTLAFMKSSRHVKVFHFNELVGWKFGLTLKANEYAEELQRQTKFHIKLCVDGALWQRLTWPLTLPTTR